MNTEFCYGDIILFELGENGDFLGKCIAYLTDSTITHSAIIFKDHTMLEMTDSGISATPFHLTDRGADRGYLVHILRMKPAADPIPVLKAGEAYLSQKIKYDYCDILLLAGLLIFKKIKIDSVLCDIIFKILYLACQVLDECYQILTQQSKNPSVMCSQLVYQCYCDCGPAYQIKLSDALLADAFNEPQCLYDYVLLQSDDIGINWNQSCALTENSTLNVTALSEELFHSLSRETYDNLPDGKFISNATCNEFNSVLKKASEFTKKLETLLKLSHSEVPLASLFVTPADLFHAKNLEHLGTATIVMDDKA